MKNKTLFEIFTSGLGKVSICLQVGEILAVKKICSNHIDRSLLNLKNFIYSDSEIVSITDESINEISLEDIANIASYFIIFSNLSSQKSYAFIKHFFIGLSKNEDFGRFTKINLNDIQQYTLIQFKRILENELNILPSYISSEKEGLYSNIIRLTYISNKSLQQFINAILGTGNINTGKLDGVVDTNETQIIYRKRNDSEFSINLTNRCPNACVFCIRDTDSGWTRNTLNGDKLNLYLHHEPSVGDIKSAILSELMNWSHPPKLVKFCGYGEPVLCLEKVIELSNFLRKLIPLTEIQLNTSGWPLFNYLNGVASLKELKDSGVNTLSISLNAPDEHTYNKLVRPGCFDFEASAFKNTLLTIKTAKDLGFKVKSSIVMLPILRNKIKECRELVENLGSFFIAREYVGKKIPGLDKEGSEFIEREAKVLNINRDQTIKKLEEIGAYHKLGGLTRLYHYDIPKDKNVRNKIKKLIKANNPENRAYFSVLAIILECIESNSTFYDRMGFLRIKIEKDETALVYKEVYGYSDYVKEEKEFYYVVESEEFAKKLVSSWHLELTRYMEKNREKYIIDDIVFDIDTWPQLGTYLEIEAEDEMRIIQGLAKISLSKERAVGLHAERLFIENQINPKELRFSQKELKELKLK